MLKSRVCVILSLLVVECRSFLVHRNQKGSRYTGTDTYHESLGSRAGSQFSLHLSSTPQKPLYDGTNYTFPDTTTPAGIAEALEVSFVNACMQIREGYVDVLKLFIAAAMSSYQFGFPIDVIETALKECPNETANRPLMTEEVHLRHSWYSLVYLTLLTIGHPSAQREMVEKSIPAGVHEKYGALISRLAAIYKDDNWSNLSVQDIIKDPSVAPKMVGLSEIEKAVVFQSTRVASLTLVVLREALDAGPGSGGQAPPTPPIKGAFE